MQAKYALNWKIFVLLLCEIYQQYQRDKYYLSNTNYLFSQMTVGSPQTYWRSGSGLTAKL
jgi:hypothetical protein